MKKIMIIIALLFMANAESNTNELDQTKINSPNEKVEFWIID